MMNFLGGIFGGALGGGLSSQGQTPQGIASGIALQQQAAQILTPRCYYEGKFVRYYTGIYIQNPNKNGKIYTIMEFK